MEIRRSSTHKFPLLFQIHHHHHSRRHRHLYFQCIHIKYGWGGAIKVAAQCSSSFYACHLLSFRLYSLTQAKQQNGIVSLSSTVEFSFKVDNHRIISYCVLYSVHWIRFIDNDVLYIYIYGNDHHTYHGFTLSCMCLAWDDFHRKITTLEQHWNNNKYASVNILDVSSEMEITSAHPASIPSPLRKKCLSFSRSLTLRFANKQSSVSLQHIYIVTDSVWFWDFKMELEMEIQTFNNMKSIHSWFIYLGTNGMRSLCSSIH